MNLRKALRAGPGSRIAFTGAGGKTTALFQLARQLQADAGTVFVTTTTHFAVEQVHFGDAHLFVKARGELPGEIGSKQGVLVLTGEGVTEGRVGGPDAGTLARLAEYAGERGFPVLVEADGSRMRPLKAPAEHEPVVPGFVDTVVVTAGLSGLGRPAEADWIHRPELFRELARLGPGEAVSPAALAAVLRASAGGRKGVPAGARAIALLNQADTPALQAAGRRIAGELQDRFDAVLVASLEQETVFAVHEAAAGIVLAAGGSSRMGRSKQVLDWGGKPLVAHVAGTALAAGCDPVVVVTGSEGEAVAGAVSGLPVKAVYNPDWAEGQSASVRVGLREALRLSSGQAGSALFLLVDQPFVEATMIRKLIETHAATLAPIVAPLIGDRRGNPVLFDRATFKDFAEIEGDAGGRQLFSRYPIEWVQWHDEKALVDLDTEDDYRDTIA